MTSDPLPVNLALSAKATASEDFGPQLRAEFGNDGNPSTRWSGISGHNEGVWFQLDWKAPVTFRQVVIQQYDTYVKELDIQAWDAAKGDWRTLQHCGNPNEKLPKVIVATVDPVTTSRLRIGNITNGPSFTEVEVYERPQPPTVVLGSDANGKVIGIVCDRLGLAPISNANVELAGEGKSGAWRASATTDRHGLFTVPMPLGLHGAVRSTVSAAGGSFTESCQAENLQYGLTPTTFGAKLTSLSGTWRFAVDPPSDFMKPSFDDSHWSDIKVPAHWEMEGFRSLTGIGGYRKSFVAPSGTGRLKLRFDGVYSGAEVWLNGHRIAYHQGGALPFEVDVTEDVKPGENVLALRVAEHTPTSDRLDQMSSYADVPLGGIMRKVTLFRVPDVHVGAYAVATPFDPEYRNARLAGSVSVLNESDSPVAKGKMVVSVVEAGGRVVASQERPFAAAAWQRSDVPIDLPVPAPKKWNAEQPNLYSLVFEVKDGSRAVQKLTRRLGFRQTEIKGSQIVVNGQPVKVRGTCHHDSHPLMGRAVTPELERLDIQLIKEANLNSIRTSHYTPIPEMIDICDEEGVYVEDEGSFCWTGATNDLRLTPRVMQMNCELVARDRNHPSVYIWSICNESEIGYGLWRSREWIQKADPSRPTTGTYHADGQMDIAVRHNPITFAEMGNLESNLKIPVIWDECWCIWQDIWGDFEELWIDPGIRDYYITHQRELYAHFIKSPVVQGTEIWAWSDDSFLLPNAGLEYGRGETPGHFAHEQYTMPGRGLTGDAQWGVVDGWRRKKPEFWHTKKLHSPVKVAEGALALPAGTTVHVPVENQYDFLNLADLAIHWQVGDEKGIAKANVAPHAAGTIDIDLARRPAVGETLSLDILDPQGRTADSYRLPFGKAKIEEPPFAKVVPKPLQTYSTSMLNGGTTYIVGNGFELGFGDVYGYLRRGVGFGRSLLRSLPQLHIAPTGKPTHPLPDLATWRLTGLDITKVGEAYRVLASGEYGEFKGSYDTTIQPDGDIVVHASFVYSGDDVWIRELGMRFETPLQEDLLKWSRLTEYSVYPDDHIGRAQGETRAFTAHDLKLPPKWGWSEDNTPLGCNDFRSTKRHIDWAWIGYPSEASAKGAPVSSGPGVLILSNGAQNVRAMVDGERLALFVTDLYDGIGSRHEWTANYGRGRRLRTGEKVETTVRLRLTPGGR